MPLHAQEISISYSPTSFQFWGGTESTEKIDLRYRFFQYSLINVNDNRLDELADMHKGSKGEELQKLSETLKEVRKALKKTPKRESAAHYRMLEPESRMIGNTVKSTAWHIEGLLAELVRDTWNGVNGSERGIVEGFLQTTGSIKQKNGVLNITLQQQATPEQTRVLKHVCDELTVMCVKYPGSQLRMVFDVADK